MNSDHRSRNAKTPRVVVLVDDRKRDLMVASLIAFQLERRGVRCFLEPLEAYQGVLAAHRPDLILFNHVSASHLVAYTQRLAKMNIKTAVSLNEGLCYDDDERAYNAQKHHQAAHIDLYFTWNQPFYSSLIESGFDAETIQVVGNPRHDFYFSPWSRAFESHKRSSCDKPLILVCTNFGLVDFYDLPRSEADKFFAPWKDRIPYLRDYMSLIKAHHNYRKAVLPHLEALLSSGEFNVILRPHPRERLDFYHSWMAKLDDRQKKLIRIDADTNITSLLLACDLVVSTFLEPSA